MSTPFDFKNPDYSEVYHVRAERLFNLRHNPELLPGLFAFYAENPAQFIDDWGMTYDPRNEGAKVVPFKLFPKQEDWINAVVEQWRAGRPMISEKSRDVGVSWLSIALASTLCLFHKELAVGYGSRKEEYVDRGGSPKSLFFKGRMFLRHLPPEFLQGYVEKKHAPHMRISFPGSGSVITGEAGDGIGRGDRAAIYFVDESAHLERPQLIDASLSATTNCRIDISSVKGMDNPFAQKRWSGKYRVHTIHWRDDPRKDDAWHARQLEELPAHIVAQEIDIDYRASVEGALIESAWIEAAIGAAGKLGLKVSGERVRSLDVADTGADKNCSAGRHGIELQHVETWSGKGSDIFATVQRAVRLCEEFGARRLRYDGDGLGAGARGDLRIINETRDKPRQISGVAFRGSGAVLHPTKPIPNAGPRHSGRREPNDVVRTNEDYFLNAKAQAWWDLRLRFQRTARAVAAKSMEGYDPDELISISPDCPELNALRMELGQPTYAQSAAGKLFVNKSPEGMPSPNRADAVMMLYAPEKRHWLT